MTATEDTRNQATATIHCAIDRVLGDATRILHAAVQADVNAQARAADLEAVIERLRREIDDLRQSNHAYAQTLTAVRESLGAVDDADLVDRARSLTTEVKRLITQDILKRERAERAESERERLRAGIALAHAYKAAVDALNGVADAEAAMFAWLEEIDHV